MLIYFKLDLYIVILNLQIFWLKMGKLELLILGLLKKLI